MKLVSGFSFSNKLPQVNDDVTNNLYELLQQWYQLFPQYQVLQSSRDSLNMAGSGQSFLRFRRILRRQVRASNHQEDPRGEQLRQ